jgi:hypothetical protein
LFTSPPKKATALAKELAAAARRYGQYGKEHENDSEGK